MNQKALKYEKAWFRMPPARLWELWHAYKENYVFEVECPYCRTYSYIWFEKEGILHLRHCSCEIPSQPTFKTILIKLHGRTN